MNKEAVLFVLKREKSYVERGQVEYNSCSILKMDRKSIGPASFALFSIGGSIDRGCKYQSTQVDYYAREGKACG